MLYDECYVFLQRTRQNKPPDQFQAGPSTPFILKTTQHSGPVVFFFFVKKNHVSQLNLPCCASEAISLCHSLLSSSCLHSCGAVVMLPLFTFNFYAADRPHHPLARPVSIYTGVAAVAGLAADAPLRPRDSSSESSSLGGRLSSWRRFLRLLVICRLLASRHCEQTKRDQCDW